MFPCTSLLDETYYCYNYNINSRKLIHFIKKLDTSCCHEDITQHCWKIGNKKAMLFAPKYSLLLTTSSFTNIVKIQPLGAMLELLPRYFSLLTLQTKLLKVTVNVQICRTSLLNITTASVLSLYKYLKSHLRRLYSKFLV